MIHSSDVENMERLLLSPSSAANIAGALACCRNNLIEGTVVTILPDNADKYSEVIKKLLEMITIESGSRRKIMNEDAAEAHFPDECCGFMFGNEDGAGNRMITDALAGEQFNSRK